MEFDTITKESIEDLNHQLDRVQNIATHQVASKESELRGTFEKAT